MASNAPAPDAVRPAVKRGLACGGVALALLAIADAPARVAAATLVAGGFGTRVVWTIAGILRDLAAIVRFALPSLAFGTCLAALAIVRLRTVRWQRAGAAFVTLPFAIVLWIVGIAAHEVKVERGAYPTLFDVTSQASSSVFLKATLGYLRYDIYWIPALVFGLAGALVVALRYRQQNEEALVAWKPWVAGLLLSFAVASLVLRLFVALSSAPDGRFSASRLGDPFQAMVDSAVDLLAYGKPATPRELVRDATLPAARIDDGASLLGWPPAREVGGAGASCRHHPHARPLDRAEEPAFQDARGEALLRAVEDVGARLFPLDGAPEGDGLLVWQLTLESFRADDLNALNPHAATNLAPFVNGLYEAAARGNAGVLASRATYQAGVRTAQGLGAIACGLGTLPYNLSLIRDLHPAPVRCLADVLDAAGFRASFFYGSDISFDGMGTFFAAHGFAERVSQSDLPANAPKGAWDAVTDFALFDETTRRVAEGSNGDAGAAPEGPRLLMVTSISNHSPFRPPADLPPDVEARVDDARAHVSNRATRDDRARLLTYSYTDAAVAHFFARLDALGLASRSIVVLSADHSTGEGYVWGPEEGSESDDAKARIPFLVVLPEALRARVKDRAALDDAMRRAQDALDAGPLSQNDIPPLLLGVLRAHPRVKAMPAAARWHTLGGQVTSPWFRPVPRPGAYVTGINSVSQLVVFDRRGARIGDYEPSVFLKMRSDRATVTPSLIPITSCLSALLRGPLDPCGP